MSEQINLMSMGFLIEEEDFSIELLEKKHKDLKIALHDEYKEWCNDASWSSKYIYSADPSPLMRDPDYTPRKYWMEYSVTRSLKPEYTARVESYRLAKKDLGL